MGSDVLATNPQKGLSIQGVPVVAGQGASGPGGGVEVSGGVAVVDCEYVSGMEGLGKGAGEGVDAQVYFCVLAFSQCDVEVSEALGEEGGGGFVDDLGQGVVFDANVDFLKFAIPHNYPMDRHGVQIFVGQDATNEISDGQGVGDDRIYSGSAVDGSTVDSDIAEGIGEGWGEVGGEFEDVGGEKAGPRAEFHCIEGSGVTQLVPHVGELDGQEGTEGGVSPGAGVEIACGAYGVGAGVVAEGRVIEG